ncbi:hypothetical protein KC19_8G112300 [Ceratodon purpureus]|uniref:F-box domain-containing protein n=1 Tax=Ceratodon purpureus TaxID=3225 RepID=A0A8T0H017_CERPU|nr:hypothetical protein KC19_8G112300 [Ceratodon purpureus]
MAQQGDLESRCNGKASKIQAGFVRSLSEIITEEDLLVDLSLWETLPKEVVESICALLPLSKILELLKLCEPWSRLPTATRFRQFCAKAHGDLFGIVMFDGKLWTYQLAIYDSKHKEWSHLELSSFLPDYMNYLKQSELFFGHDGGLMCVIPYDFYFHEAPPCILVFNPLTGDKKYIGVSSFIASFDPRTTLSYVVLLQLIMDGELGCYKLILVTQRTKPRVGGVEYYSESYDSMSGVWSTLDSGFVYGDGMMRYGRQHVCFDCRLKKFCRPAESGKTVRNPSPHVYHSNVVPDDLYYPFHTFVRDHRFKLEFAEVDTDEDNFSSTAEVLESVWQNGWNEKSKISLAMEMPCEDFEARLLACTRYILMVTDGGRFADSEHCRQHMALFDRVTCEETVLNIPRFMTKEFCGAGYSITSNLESMCDLKWDVVP